MFQTASQTESQRFCKWSISVLRLAFLKLTCIFLIKQLGSTVVYSVCVLTAFKSSSTCVPTCVRLKGLCQDLFHDQCDTHLFTSLPLHAMIISSVICHAHSSLTDHQCLFTAFKDSSQHSSPLTTCGRLWLSG